MKTTDPNLVCPYTGLRSFTEEESLYFKGRDSQVDQVIDLLEQNKFLMVTGASGEGKSSLIYGGLVPNARAGFFKAHYTNWVVADFRPERSPVTNMAKALADKFERQPATIETELRRGFSSLVDLYTNSDYHTDEHDEQWKSLDEPERKEKRRKAANLLIIVDQFEEFFTNPENFFHETLSQDSQVVVNLILETARIALKRNLPIYLVCTMRSDYIGQCSAFRGLPEYIGFSQFFVPRLKRKDLKQVIEEPAVLSGNRISQRLIERLVFDISEGIDQLPILQHALSQIWLAADHGQEEMDLIHYAMVGGMPANELPDDDQKRFVQWFKTLPEYKREYFHTTGLNKAIEIHANSLYEAAWEYHNQLFPGKPISKQQSKRIIAIAFSCLTKIDNSRAVRNRMTLQEITEIINAPEISTETVGAVLSIYRDEGNAFIRPFKTIDTATHALSPDTVLDITHESLIRNWNKLDEWANTEFEYYTTYLDFRTQLNRWKQNKKSGDYLLPIGPLTYFETWFAKCNPNSGWIKRYAENKHDAYTAEKEATEILVDTRDFLKRSTRKVIITRTFMKYGTQRIAAVVAILFMLVLSGFYWYDAEQKQNDRVITSLRKQAVSLLDRKEIDNFTKAEYLLTEERYEPGSLLPYLNGLEGKDQIGLSIAIFQRLAQFDKYFNLPVKNDLVQFVIQQMSAPEFEKDQEFALINRNKFVVLLTYDEYYNPNKERRESIAAITDANVRLVNHFYDHPELFKPTVPSELNQAIQFWLTFGQTDQQKITELLRKISPLQDGLEKPAFTMYYPKGSFEPNGRESNDFNGGYHILASLYAASGDVENIIKCFEAIVKNGQKGYLEVARVFNNHINIIGYLYQYGHRQKAQHLIQWISTNTEGNPPLTLLRNAVIRSGYNGWAFIYNIVKQTRSYKGYFNPNLCMSDRKVFNALMEDYEKVVLQIKDHSERNYLLAIHYKRKAMYDHKYHFDRNLPVDQSQLDLLFGKAIDHYRMIDPEYLLGTINITIPYWTDGVRTRPLTRRQSFIYPDYMDGWFDRPFHSDAFFNYLEKKNLLSELYQTGTDLGSLHLWLSKAYEVDPRDPSDAIKNYYPLPDRVLTSILSFVEMHPQGGSFDRNLPIIMLANRAFNVGDTVGGMRYFKKLDLETLPRSYGRYEYLEQTFFLNQVKALSVNLAINGKNKEAIQLTEQVNRDHQKVYNYIAMADKVYKKDTSAMTFIYLDSAFSIGNRIDFTTAPLDSRFNLVYVLSGIGGKEMNAKSLEIMRDFNLNAKVGGLMIMAWGVAREGNYYRAASSIPSTFTEDEDLFCRGLILWEECKKRETNLSANNWKSMDNFFMWDLEYIFYMPN